MPNSEGGVVLVRVNKMLIIFEERAWPIRGGELISRHQKWGAAELARRRIEPVKKTRRPTEATSGTQGVLN